MLLEQAPLPCPDLQPGVLPVTRPYDMRHTCATLLLSRDVNVRVDSEQLGHEDSQTTLRFYAHALPNMQARAVQAINSLLPADCPTDVPQEGTAA